MYLLENHPCQAKNNKQSTLQLCTPAKFEKAFIPWLTAEMFRKIESAHASDFIALINLYRATFDFINAGGPG